MKKILIALIVISLYICVFSEEIPSQLFINFNLPLTNGNYPDVELSRDELVDSYSLMNEINGIFPSDICYVQDHNKIFVYGNKFIHVYDSNSYNLIHTIDISDHGHFDPWSSHFNDKRLAYSNGKLYCVTEDIELLMIDAVDYEISVQSRPSIVSENSDTIDNMIIRFNQYDNRLYWIINDYDIDEYSTSSGDNIGGKLAIYDIVGDELELIHEKEFTTPWVNRPYEYFINDIDFSPTINHFYLSVNHEIIVYNTDPVLNFGFVESHQTEHYAGLLEYVYMGQVNKLICAPKLDLFCPSNTFFKILNFNNSNVIDIPANYHTYSGGSCIDYINDKVYFSSNNEGDVTIDAIDFNSNELNVFYNGNDATIFSLLFNPNNNVLFSCKSQNIEVIDCSVTPATSINNFHYQSSKQCNASINLRDNKVYIPSLSNASMEVFNGNGDFVTSVNAGEEAYYGVPCEGADKLIIWKTYGEKILIFDTLNHTTNEININGRYVMTIDADSNGNLIILYDDGYVDWYNYYTMNLVNHSQSLYPGNPFNKGLLIAENGKIYAGSSTGIDIWEFNYTHEMLVRVGALENYPAFKFIYDNENEMTYAISSFSISVIDNQNNISLYNVPQNMCQIQYYNDKIYFLSYDPDEETSLLYSLDIDTGETEILLPNNGDILLYLVKLNDKLYINALNPSNANSVYVFDCQNEILDDYFEIPFCSSQLCANDYNNKIYSLTLFDRIQDDRMTITTIEPDNLNTVATIPLNYQERQRGFGIFLCGFYSGTSLIPFEDKLYVVRGYNVVQEILCTEGETKILSRGWNWESFPRLERDAQMNGEAQIVPLFETIPNFSYNVEYLETQKVNGVLKYFSEPQGWIPSEDWPIQSTWLYKIDVDPEDDWQMEITGTRMEPDYQVAPSNGGNFMGDGTWYWLGYWLTDSYDMDIAFPDNVWQWVKHVKAEEWYYGIPENNRDPVIEPKPSNQMRALEYGKGYMVQFKTVDEGFPEEGLPPFQWSTGETSEGYERTQTENFDYDELPDYEVIDVLGIPENVIEIGVFQDTLCVGAVVVQDSSEQILVYVENSLREQVPYNFEVVTNNRSIEEVFDYSVFNNYEGIFEQGCLIAGSQPYSIVKFGNIGISHNNTPNIDKIILNNNYPNPFNPETNISFSIPLDQKVKLTIYNLKGQKVKKLINGQIVSGNHSVVWNGKDDNGKQVGSGLYFYNLKTDDKEISKKMLLLK